MTRVSSSTVLKSRKAHKTGAGVRETGAGFAVATERLGQGLGQQVQLWTATKASGSVIGLGIATNSTYKVVVRMSGNWRKLKLTSNERKLQKISLLCKKNE